MFCLLKLIARINNKKRILRVAYTVRVWSIKRYRDWKEARRYVYLLNATVAVSRKRDIKPNTECQQWESNYCNFLTIKSGIQINDLDISSTWFFTVANVQHFVFFLFVFFPLRLVLWSPNIIDNSFNYEIRLFTFYCSIKCHSLFCVRSHIKTWTRR